MRFKVKSRKLWKLSMLPWGTILEPWRLTMEINRLTVELWRVFRPLVAHSDEDPDPDPQQNEKTDPNRHQSDAAPHHYY